MPPAFVGFSGEARGQAKTFLLKTVSVSKAWTTSEEEKEQFANGGVTKARKLLHHGSERSCFRAKNKKKCDSYQPTLGRVVDYDRYPLTGRRPADKQSENYKPIILSPILHSSF